MPGTFNREQEEAITHKGGPLMVLAGTWVRKDTGNYLSCKVAYRKCRSSSV